MDSKGNTEHKIQELLNELKEQLKYLKSKKPTVLEMAERSIYACTDIIDELKKIIIQTDFKNKEKEIEFFKSHKPAFVSRLIYYLTLYNIECGKPTGTIEVQREYLNEELNKLNDYYNENVHFYRYYRTNSTHLDHKYFMRGNHDIRLSVEAHFFESDPRFSTGHDSIISRIRAYERLQSYLVQEIQNLEFSNQENQLNQNDQTPLNWTASKVALTELMYGLHTTGVLNHGNASMKEIATFFEKMFDIELGQFYRIYTELRMRQDRTKFLDDMQKSVARKMEEDDEK